jgi:hypothetical protein
MNESNPSVRKLIGNVNMRSNVPIVAFTNAIKIPALSALKKPSTYTSGDKAYAAINTANPIKRISKITFISVLIFFLNIIVIGCRSAGNDLEASKISIKLNTDSTSIGLEGLESSVISDLRTAGLKTGDWQNMFPVYRGNSERQELLVPGTYKITTGNVVVFQPDSVFKRDSSYSALFFYPKYYSVKNLLGNRSMPGKVTVIEGHFQF